MSSEPIRGTSQIPQPVRQSTRMPATLPTLGESAVTGSTAARRVALQQFAEGMDTWWRKARAAIQNDYEELASSASSAITAASDSASALRTEIQERITQNETIVAQIQALVLNSGNSRVFIQTEAPDSPALYDTWFDTDDDFHEYVYGGAAWVDVRDRAISGAIAAVGTEQVARMNADSVLSGRIDTVVTRMTNAETGITGLNTAIDAVQTTVTAQGESITAQGARITSLESSVNTANTGLLARVATIEGTYATDTEVSAAIASEVSARNGAISSAVSTETSARVAADGAIHARWGVAIDVNGAVVGRVQLDGTNQTSAFTVDASKFTVWNGTAAVPPFQVIGGQVRVANLSLISADITDRSLANIDSAAATKLGGIAAGADVTLNAINGGLKITSGGVTLAGTGSIKSSNFAAGSAGWSISAAGDAEFNSIILRNPLLYYPLATPTISPSQVFASSLAITATAAAGATIRYSTGGSVTATSTEWPKSGQNYTTLTITDSATLRVRAFNGTQQSDEVIATYTKNTTVRPNLTNDTCVCPSAADGSNPVLTQAVTTMEVFLGSTDDSAGWTYTATPSAGVTGALAGRTWTTTGFTSDTGYVDISAAKSGIGTVVERFNLSKAKAGAPGAGAFTLVNDAGCAVGPDWIQRTSVFTGMLDAAAHSLQSYVGGAFLSFNGAQVNANLAVGLTSDPATNTSYDSIDFCWVLWSSGYCAVLTNGTQVSGIAAYTTSTVFSIAYDGKQVQFLMDGAVRHTVAATSGLGLYLDAAFYNPSKVTNIVFIPQGASGTNGQNGSDGIPAAPNMIQNSDFVNDVSGWSEGINPQSVTSYVSRADSSGGWGLAGAGSLAHFFPGTPPNGGLCDVKYGATPGTGYAYGVYTKIPVVAGQRYQASAYLGVHRLTAQVAVAFCDASGNDVGGTMFGNVATSSDGSLGCGGTTLAGYTRSYCFGIAPANASFAVFVIRSLFNGGTDPYMFATRCFFGDATTMQTQPSPWMPAAPAGVAAFTLVNDANCATGPNWIQRTNGADAWDAAAHTLESYVGGAFLSFNGAQVNANLAVGLTSDPATNTSYDSIDFCWVLWSSGYCAVLTNGTQVSGIAAYTTSTVFSIAYDGKQVQFLMDGAVRHTVAATSGLGLYLDTSFYNASAKVTNITFGPQGAAGADSTAYWLTSSTSTLKLSGTTFTPANITFTARSQTGTGAPGDYAGRFVISESTDGTTFTNVYTSAANEATVTRTPSAGIKSLRARLYLAGGTASLIDEETVPVVTDGTDGTNGATVLGTVGGSGSASPNNTWANITTFASAVTAPAGTRLITFSGMAVNSSGAANSIDVAIYVGNQYIALGAISVAAGGMRSVNLIATPTMASPGTLYVDMAVRGTTGNQIVLSGTLVIQ